MQVLARCPRRRDVRRLPRQFREGVGRLSGAGTRSAGRSRARRDYYDDPDAPAANSIVPAVTAVVTDRDRVLLIHRTDNDRWALPGGGVELGESACDALVREVSEQPGTDVEVTGIVGTHGDPRHVIAYDDGEARPQFSLCFAAETTGGTLTGSSESREVRWVPVGDIEYLDLHPARPAHPHRPRGRPGPHRSPHRLTGPSAPASTLPRRRGRPPMDALTAG